MKENLMQDTPLVSVITAFLNEEKFLQEAVESVLQQDYSNWELLLVDDGSTDNSTIIALDYEKKYPGKIFYVEHQDHINKGLSASRNKGIEQAKGALVAFLDADDCWRKNKLSNQVQLFSQHKEAAMIAEASEYWYNWFDASKKNVVIPIGAPQDRLYEPLELIHFLYPLSNGAAPCPSGIIIKQEALARSGLFEESFRKEYGLYEDQAFLHKMYLREKVFISAACNNLYRQHANSIVASVRASGKYKQVRKYFLDWLVGYIKQNNIQNKQLDQLIRGALYPYQQPLSYFFRFTAHKLYRKLFIKMFKKSSAR